MLTAPFRRTAVLVLLTAVLATPSVSAQTGSVRPTDLLDRVLSFLRPYLKEGCKIDPDGHCYTSVAKPPYTKEGCKIDPNGSCYTSMTQPPYAGCKIDPNGRCLP
jgi:hypothetical protein